MIDSVIILDSQSFTTTTGDNNNVPTASSNFQVTCTSNLDGLTGVAASSMEDGAQLWVTNAGASNDLVIKHNDSGSSSANRFILPDGSGELILKPGRSQHFGYNPSLGWVPISASLLPYVVPYTPTTGQTLSMPDGDRDVTLFLDPAGTLASLTVNLPTEAKSRRGQTVGICATQDITSFTLQGAATIMNNPTTLIAGDFFRFQKMAANTWVRIA